MTLAELTTPLTVDEVKASIYAAIEAKGTLTASWKPGATARTIVAAVSIVIAAFSRLVSLIAASGFLALAEGDWLTLVALHVYGVERDLGSFATGEVRLNNTGGGVYSGDPGDLVLKNTSTGKTYRNTAAFSIGALEANVFVPIQAIEIGTDSNAGPGDIDDFETLLLGVVVTNLAPVLGTDVEEDDALKARCSAKTGTLSPNGPRDAYHYVALSAKRAADGTSIGVTRVLTVPDGVGGVDVYVATATGAIAGDAGDPDTDLGAVAEAIHTQVEPLAITPVVQSAVAELIDVTYELWVRNTSSLSDAEIEVRVGLKLSEYLATSPIGGFLLEGEAAARIYVSALEAVIASALPGREVRVEVTVPAADVVIAATEAPVLGDVAAEIHQVSTGVL